MLTPLRAPVNPRGLRPSENYLLPVFFRRLYASAKLKRREQARRRRRYLSAASRGTARSCSNQARRLTLSYM
jgi:hypothetical protein